MQGVSGYCKLRSTSPAGLVGINLKDYPCYVCNNYNPTHVGLALSNREVCITQEL